MPSGLALGAYIRANKNTIQPSELFLFRASLPTAPCTDYLVKHRQTACCIKFSLHPNIRLIKLNHHLRSESHGANQWYRLIKKLERQILIILPPNAITHCTRSLNVQTEQNNEEKSQSRRSSITAATQPAN